MLFKQPDATRNSIEAEVTRKLAGDERDEAEEILSDSINLATRLLLMMPTDGSVSSRRYVTVSGETKLSLRDGTVKDTLNEEMKAQIFLEERVKLEKIFNARNLQRIGGIKIRWTTNFADHLRMREDDTAVEVFHYASFLQFHQNSNSSIIPAALVEETLRTLALLFPEHDKAVKVWFERQQKQLQTARRMPLDALARECGQLKAEERQIDRFVYWHDRLVILKQVFDEAEPRNIAQWWNDRRKRVQWYTFWVAAVVLALTVFFGLVQSIEGALQVYLAYSHP
ncbi:hypothetical protein LSUE1_G000134 [Lachnellula suecica]|uniref:Uncharacterized protein n=1 Tax=Lachnellula suecica TaxID=602035 RepID=A0A8T9CJ31_9HELO|nr:hypothetical protein LSUE1_G000134 [Lachnellula suecica]